MGKLRIGIVGSRNFGDLVRVAKLVEILKETKGDFVLVSGGAKGVDRAAAAAARARGLEVVEHLPKEDVKPFAKAAMERNTKIVEDSDFIFAFWSVTKESTGTVDTMRKALMAGKLVGIYTPKGAFENSYVTGPE